MPASTNSPKWAFAPSFKKWCKALCASLLLAASPAVYAQAQIGQQSFSTDSLAVTYFGTGKPRIIASYRDGLLHGPTFEYHASGQIN